MSFTPLSAGQTLTVLTPLFIRSRELLLSPRYFYQCPCGRDQHRIGSVTGDSNYSVRAKNEFLRFRTRFGQDSPENVQPLVLRRQQTLSAMEVVSNASGGPGPDLVTRDAVVQMFREFHQEMAMLLNESSRTADALREDVSEVKEKLGGLRAEQDFLQQAFNDLKIKVVELKNPPVLPRTPEEDSVVSRSKSSGSFPSNTSAKKNIGVRIFIGTSQGFFCVLEFSFCIVRFVSNCNMQLFCGFNYIFNIS